MFHVFLSILWIIQCRNMFHWQQKPENMPDTRKGAGLLKEFLFSLFFFHLKLEHSQLKLIILNRTTHSTTQTNNSTEQKKMSVESTK